MKHNLSEIILGNWGGIKLNANIDEKMEDVKLMIKYSDHSDEFLIVKTKSGIYEYGWWLNRSCGTTYNELINSQSDHGFIRKPKLFYAFDNKGQLSNEIYRKIHGTGTFWGNMGDGFVGDFCIPNKECSENYAQIKFDEFVEYMNTVYKLKITYDKSDDKEYIQKYLECNNILTDENVIKLNTIKWTSKVDGADGIAGKKPYMFNRVCGDDIEFIFYKGKILDINKIKISYNDDSWGVETFNLTLKQFK